MCKLQYNNFHYYSAFISVTISLGVYIELGLVSYQGSRIDTFSPYFDSGISSSILEKTTQFATELIVKKRLTNSRNKKTD